METRKFIEELAFMSKCQEILMEAESEISKLLDTNMSIVPYSRFYCETERILRLQHIVRAAIGTLVQNP